MPDWEKRAKNRESSETVLTRHGIAHESRNNGAHLIVRRNNYTVDFWPGTGKYIFRETSPVIQGRGVFNLIRQLGG
jgi:hypothetical protein